MGALPRLYDHLMTNYRKVCPRINSSQPVEVGILIELYGILDLVSEHLLYLIHVCSCRTQSLFNLLFIFSFIYLFPFIYSINQYINSYIRCDGTLLSSRNIVVYQSCKWSYEYLVSFPDHRTDFE